MLGSRWLRESFSSPGMKGDGEIKEGEDRQRKEKKKGKILYGSHQSTAVTLLKQPVTKAKRTRRFCGVLFIHWNTWTPTNLCEYTVKNTENRAP